MQFAFPEPTACSRLRQEQFLWHRGYNIEAEETCTCCSNLLLGNLSAKPILSQLCWAVNWGYEADVSSGFWENTPLQKKRREESEMMTPCSITARSARASGQS